MESSFTSYPKIKLQRRAGPRWERTKQRNFVPDLARRREVETVCKKRANKLVVSLR
jgi:hypothetical protein